MDDELLLRQAVDTAWTVYLRMHSEVDAADARRCTLARHVERRWQAGEHEPEELTCSGLSYLSRVPPDCW